jgi:signal peptidase I
MQIKEQRSWMAESTDVEDRERVVVLRDWTLAYQAAGGVKRALRKRKAPLTPVQRIIHIGFNMIFWLLTASLIAIMFTAMQSKRNGGIPSILGYSVLRVETGSMVPTLPIGSYIIAKAPKSPESLPVGTITTFRFINGTVVTHRVIEVIEEPDGTVRYRTKGDNPINDPDPELLTPDRVIGIFQFMIKMPTVWRAD